MSQPWWKFSASFNAAPMRNVPVVRLYQDQTEGVMLQWGLIPEWAEGDAQKGCIAHAAAEEVARSAMVCGAWSRGLRCIVPARGFYGWHVTPQRYRQPYFIRLANRAVFGIAAVWDRTVREDDDDVIEGCAMLTVPANPLMCEVSGPAPRMPAILRRQDYEAWLGAPPAEAASLLRTYPQEAMVAHAISPRINALKYDDAALIEPIERFGGLTPGVRCRTADNGAAA